MKKEFKACLIYKRASLVLQPHGMKRDISILFGEAECTIKPSIVHLEYSCSSGDQAKKNACRPRLMWGPYDHISLYSGGNGATGF
jgi:hypothetical protein